jgi:hypothetical protein
MTLVQRYRTPFFLDAGGMLMYVARRSVIGLDGVYQAVPNAGLRQRTRRLSAVV